VDPDIRERGFVVRRGDAGGVDVSSPQPLAERVAVLGAAVYAIAIVVEAIRSRAWLAAALFIVIALSAVWVANARVRYRLGRNELEVTRHSLLRRFTVPARDREMRMATADVLDFVAASGVVRVVVRDGSTIDLPRGTMRSHDEALALATFLREHLSDLREREAGYRSF
jgi:hypothetical protein